MDVCFKKCYFKKIGETRNGKKFIVVTNKFTDKDPVTKEEKKRLLFTTLFDNNDLLKDLKFNIEGSNVPLDCEFSICRLRESEENTDKDTVLLITGFLKKITLASK